MSEPPHHPDDGPGDGGPSGAEERPLRHNWFFYVAGFFLAVAVICFVLSHTLPSQSAGAPLPQPTPSSNANGK